MLHSWMMLALEANQVVGLRMWKLMAGGKLARREAELMVSEKIEYSDADGKPTKSAT